MDGSRSALIVANDSYSDPGLSRLRAPDSDAQALAGVLRDPAIGDFDVRVLLNQPAHEVNLAVEELFADRRPDDLLLLHFSCHGLKDESGELFFAAANTRLRRLGATAVAAEFVNRRMNRSRSRRVVLLLDCCYAGAFERGMTARAGTGIGIGEQFGGRGRAVITASSAMEYAFEGDELADVREQAPSVFTSALVEGLQTGEADRDQDGLVALDELYDYVYDRVRAVTPNQTPGKWTFGVQGELVIARRAGPVSEPVPLPRELQEAVDSPFASVRAAAVQELARLLHGRHAGLALAARLSLERLANDDSRSTSAEAAAALAAPAAPATGVPPVPEPRVAEPPPPVPEPRVAEPPPPAAPVAGPPMGAEQADAPPAGEQAATDVRAVGDTDEVEATPAAADAGTAGDANAVGGIRTVGGEAVAGGTVGEGPAGGSERRDRRFRGTGTVAMVGAVLVVVGLLPAFRWGDPLGTVAPGVTWYFVVMAALAAAAGGGMLVPGSRVVATGLLVGAAAAATWWLLGSASLLVLSPYRDALGYGYWLEVAGHLLMVGAAGVAAVGLVRSGEVRPARWPPRDTPARLVVLLGVASVLPLLLNARPLAEAKVVDLHLLVVSFGWIAAMAVAVPAVAAAVAPRRFGASLLLGWIGGAGAVVLGYQLLRPNTYTGGPLLGFALTLLALLVAAVVLARSHPPAEPQPATPA